MISNGHASPDTVMVVQMNIDFSLIANRDAANQSLVEFEPGQEYEYLPGLSGNFIQMADPQDFSVYPDNSSLALRFSGGWLDYSFVRNETDMQIDTVDIRLNNGQWMNVDWYFNADTGYCLPPVEEDSWVDIKVSINLEPVN